MKKAIQLLCICYLVWMTLALIRGGDPYQSGAGLYVLETVNFIFHEAGHFIFAVFGEFVAFFGGTLNQLLVPLVFVGYFALQKQWLSSLVMVWWFGENCIGISRYIADARAQAIVLWGGEHDWAYLLGQMGLLPYDTLLGSVVWWFGVGSMCISSAFLLTLVVSATQKKQKEQTPC